MPGFEGPLVEVRALEVAYGPVRAVRGLDLSVPDGQVLALVGPNGAGKSSVINSLLGLRQPSAGRIRIAGLPPRAAVRSGYVGAMQQAAGLPSGARVGEVLRLAAALHKDGPRPRELAGLAGLDDLARRDVATLSGGQAQRLRFAIAVAGRPRLLFLDEPTAAMDVHSRQHFWRALRAKAAAGTTVLFATHYLEEAHDFADRIVVISAGRVVADGTAGELKAGAELGQTVEVTAEAPEAIEALVLPDVTEVTVHGRTVRLRTDDADGTVRRLYESGIAFHGLSVTGERLDDVLLALTAPDEER